MAKKLKPGQKRCPSCGASVSGPRTKTCPKCNHEFNGKPTVKAALATVTPANSAINGGDKPEVNKAQAVRDYLTANPEAGPSAVVAALKKQGITITAKHVSNIKAKLKNAGNGKKKAAEPAPEVAPARSAVEKPATNGGTITLEQVKKVAHTIKTLGGFQRVIDVLDVIKELGGVKKFKDLAEAMTVPEPDVVVF